MANAQGNLFQDNTEDVNPNDDARVSELGQYMTPRWAAEILLARMNPTRHDFILEPSCGKGSFIHAANILAPDATVIGCEIDPRLAEIARIDTGRMILTGDFLDDALTAGLEPTLTIANPPYTSEAIAAFIRKAYEMMPTLGRAGFLMPVHSLSFAQRTLEVLRGFEVSIELTPRDLYPRISFPLLFAKMQKTGVTRLVGFACYEEATGIRSMRAEYRKILNEGRKPIWREVTTMAISALGGEASLKEIFEVIEDFRPTNNKFWRDGIRRVAGDKKYFVRVSEGRFRLPEAVAA